MSDLVTIVSYFIGGAVAAFVDHRIPGRLVDQACVGPLDLSFYGSLELTAEGGERWWDRGSFSGLDSGVSGESCLHVCAGCPGSNDDRGE